MLPGTTAPPANGSVWAWRPSVSQVPALPSSPAPPRQWYKIGHTRGECVFVTADIIEASNALPNLGPEELMLITLPPPGEQNQAQYLLRFSPYGRGTRRRGSGSGTYHATAPCPCSGKSSFRVKLTLSSGGRLEYSSVGGQSGWRRICSYPDDH